MSSEIVVPETPNWLKTLEEKREHRLKARLGHEAGAGAPCLKCGDKCPGLDLHFWRKACKICRCPKEEHDVHDDDIYGWTQFQLLGSKPNKIKTKIVLPGKKDEVELEWAPKGQKETIDKYLKTLPPESLPVKGSQAAQERKQMLQKQIPVHDIDPSLCHELNEEEVKKMEEYIAHIKKSSVGVGQIVNLSSVIKANLHSISPQEAHIIASRYSKGIPFSEIVKLQSGLAKNLEKLTLNDPKNPKNKATLPNMQPNKQGSNVNEQDVQNPVVAAKFKDITHPWYTGSSPHKGLPLPQYTQGFKPGQPGGHHDKNPDYQAPDYSIDQKLLQGTNFDSSKTPSQFLGYHTPGYKPEQYRAPHSQDQYPSKDGIPYDKQFSRIPSSKISSSSDVEHSEPLKSGVFGGCKEVLPHGVNKLPHSEQYGFENPYFNQNIPGGDSKYKPNSAGSNFPSKANRGQLPGYSPSKYDPKVDSQDPKAPRSVKDLIYSTYDPGKGPFPEGSDMNSSRDKNREPIVPGYDPNATFSTFKHDPSVIRYENPPLLGKSDPAQLLSSANKPGKQTNPGQRYTEYPNDPKNPEDQYRSVYLDSKTGKYVTENDIKKDEDRYDPSKPGYGNRIPGDPKYDPKNPQNRYKPLYFDSKKGKYVTVDDINSGEDQYDPSNPGQVNVSPRNPDYDPKNLRNRYKPVYFDPRAEKYVTSIPKVDRDPKNALIGYKPVYFDTKTGQYIPEDAIKPQEDHYDPTNPGQRSFVPGQSKYDPKDPQNRYKPVYFDTKTGNNVTGDEVTPMDGHYDPRNPEQVNVSPLHPSYDPKNPQNRYKPLYFNPETGQYSTDLPAIGNYDPRNAQNRWKPVYFDTITEQHIPEDAINPQEGQCVPTNPGQRGFVPGHSKYDPKDPQNRYKPVYFDTKTGNNVTGDEVNPGDGQYDPRNPGQVNVSPLHPSYDPKNPQNRYKPLYFNPETGQYSTDLPANGNYDPRNAQNRRKPVYFDTITEQYIPEDAINPEDSHYDPTNPNYDPKNLRNRYKPLYFDSNTGNYVTQDDINAEEGQHDPGNPDQVNVVPGHPKYDPRNPQNRYKPVYYDPQTGNYFTGDNNNFEDNDLNSRNPAGPYGPGNIDPSTGKQIPGSGIYPGGNSGPNRPHNIPGIDNSDTNNPGYGRYPNHRFGNTTPSKLRKPLNQLQPGQLTVPEDYLEPHMVNVGAIQDINPDIKAATTEINPGFDSDSVFSDSGSEYSPESIREILNNIKLPDCHYCRKPFDENEYAVTVDRANVLFHAQCFKCAGCNQSLADNIYFYHKETNNVYCGRDYAKIKGYPRCTACDELIFTKEYCLAENSTFHLKHFCCFQCDTPLAGQDYTLEEDKPYCLPCYETSKAAKCSTCDNVIKPDEVGCQLNGVHFHAEDRCFRCIVCSVPLMGKKLLLREGKLYCSHDCFNSVKKK